MIERLTRILSLNRAHGSPGVQHLVDTEFHDYAVETFYNEKNQALALVIQVGDKNGALFSAHLDTAETWDGQLKRKVFIKDKCMYSDGGHVLGADDGAGIVVLLEMIDAGVPGTYIFHHGEERGGVGSKGMSLHFTDFLSEFKYAIAFDRRGVDSVITHQAMGRCCSDEFAEALAAALNGDDPDLMFSPDATGIYTDTAEYTGLIGECTNVSCGYYDEHRNHERLDVVFLEKLIQRCKAIDWSSLPTKREPGTDDGWDYRFGWNYQNVTRMPRKDPFKLNGYDMDEWDIYSMNYAEVAKFVGGASTDELTALLIQLADTAVDLQTQGPTGNTFDQDPIPF